MPQASLRLAVAVLPCCALAVLANRPALACTAFCAAANDKVLVGNNEDWDNPSTKIWFVPATPGSYGRLYVGFDDLWPQGGMNERGLWFDGFAAPAVKATESADLPSFRGNIIDKAMAECGTVEEVVHLFGQYNRAFLTQGILMFADALGDAVSIEPNATVRKTGAHFVQTNFHQSRPQSRRDGRFTIASTMLEEAGGEISTDLFRRILAATHQKGSAPTQYSNIYELRSRTMSLYYFHDFERVVTFNLAEELKKGARTLDIPSLFPRNAAADAFAANRPVPGGPPGAAAVIAVVALLCTGIGLAVYGWIHAGREFRVGLSVLVAVVATVIVLTVLTLEMHHKTSAPWIEFAIGPASGESANIGTSAIRASGITLKAAIATAYNMPGVRIIGPRWLEDTRYSLRAVVGLDDEGSFRSLLQQELKNRLRLETHIEVRPFDVFVLSTSGAPQLARAHGQNTRIWIQKQEARFQEAPMEGIVGALQGILGKPVLDETGLTGTFDFEFGWTDDRVASVTAVLKDRFGLTLTPATREMDALIVDGVRRDAALLLLAEVGRVTRRAPPYFRQHIAAILTIR